MTGTAILSDDGTVPEFRDINWTLNKVYATGDLIEIWDGTGWINGVVTGGISQWGIQTGTTHLRLIDFPNPPAGFVARL